MRTACFAITGFINRTRLQQRKRKPCQQGISTLFFSFEILTQNCQLLSSLPSAPTQFPKLSHDLRLKITRIKKNIFFRVSAIKLHAGWRSIFLFDFLYVYCCDIMILILKLSYLDVSAGDFKMSRVCPGFDIHRSLFSFFFFFFGGGGGGGLGYGYPTRLTIRMF